MVMYIPNSKSSVILYVGKSPASTSALPLNRKLVPVQKIVSHAHKEDII